ncbi:hypothetical protein SLE2022_405580 [Rubroshorea leprosula]
MNTFSRLSSPRSLTPGRKFPSISEREEKSVPSENSEVGTEITLCSTPIFYTEIPLSFGLLKELCSLRFKIVP